ncbi:MAG: cation diffusion facilitator family transporter [Tissierellia bacterium]|nr:cation diffusion facilitator family transporter [Tissierellia bacterium]
MERNDQRTDLGRSTALLGIFLNGALALGKIVLGSLSGAVSITADGWNNFSDLLSAVVALVGFHFADAPPDAEHPFGHERSEYLATFVVGLMILFTGGQLVLSSGRAVLHPAEMEVSWLTLGALILSMGVKLFLYFFYRARGRRTGSDLILANAIDSRNDVLSTGAVFLSVLIFRAVAVNIDGLVGLGVSVLVLYSGFELLKDNITDLLGPPPDPHEVEKIQDFLLSYPGVLGVHDLIIHHYGPQTAFLTVHVEVDSEEDVIHLHELLDGMERDVEEAFNLNTTIHMDPLQVNDATTREFYHLVKEVVAEVDPSTSIHDFRIVKAREGWNVLFDVLLPPGVNSSKELDGKLRRALGERRPDWNLVIEYDANFLPQAGRKTP